MPAMRFMAVLPYLLPGCWGGDVFISGCLGWIRNFDGPDRKTMLLLPESDRTIREAITAYSTPGCNGKFAGRNSAATTS